MKSATSWLVEGADKLRSQKCLLLYVASVLVSRVSVSITCFLQATSLPVPLAVAMGLLSRGRKGIVSRPPVRRLFDVFPVLCSLELRAAKLYGCMDLVGRRTRSAASAAILFITLCSWASRRAGPRVVVEREKGTHRR